jgi:hypothetical protein
MPRSRFTHREGPPDSHWIGCWVGLRAGVDTETRGKILCFCGGLNPSQQVVPFEDETDTFTAISGECCEPESREI